MMRTVPQERVARGVYVQALRDHWRVRVRHERFDEGRERYPFKSRDHGEALEFARRLAEKLEAAHGERTVGDVLAVFERRYLPTVRRTTEELWRNVIAKHLRPLIGDTPLGHLSRPRAPLVLAGARARDAQPGRLRDAGLGGAPRSRARPIPAP
jgi:hypothetical protein